MPRFPQPDPPSRLPLRPRYNHGRLTVSALAPDISLTYSPRDLPARDLHSLVEILLRAPEGLSAYGAVMGDESATKRAIAFFDGQDLYRHAKGVFTSGSKIDDAKWYPTDRAFYDACLDSQDYHSRRPAR